MDTHAYLINKMKFTRLNKMLLIEGIHILVMAQTKLKINRLKSEFESSMLVNKKTIEDKGDELEFFKFVNGSKVTFLSLMQLTKVKDLKVGFIFLDNRLYYSKIHLTIFKSRFHQIEMPCQIYGLMDDDLIYDRFEKR